jgi:hypothetical protein
MEKKEKFERPKVGKSASPQEKSPKEGTTLLTNFRTSGLSDYFAYSVMS